MAAVTEAGPARGIAREIYLRLAVAAWEGDESSTDPVSSGTLRGRRGVPCL